MSVACECVMCVLYLLYLMYCVLSSGNGVLNPILLVRVHAHMMLINVLDGGMIICNVESS